MNASDVLNKTADRLESNGWLQGGLGGIEGPNCTVGALRIAGEVPEECLVPDGPVEDAWHSFMDYIGGVQIADWNDHPRRTATEVVEALRAAALIEAAKENPGAAREGIGSDAAVGA